jgi:hypothetical protein
VAGGARVNADGGQGGVFAIGTGRNLIADTETRHVGLFKIAIRIIT